MKIKNIVLTLTLAFFVSTLFVVNAQAASNSYSNSSDEKPRKRKKAPKRKSKKFKKVKKADLKYVDKSESSKMRLYDPITKKPIAAKETKKFDPKTAGGKKFKSMGCIMCHKIGTARLGPSLAKLAKTYDGKKDRLIKYLKRDKKTKPLIGSERAAVMKAQLAKLTILSDEQYEELTKFILSGGK